jgi:hypothetical protein
VSNAGVWGSFMQARQEGTLDSLVDSLASRQKLLDSLQLIPPEFAPLHRKLAHVILDESPITCPPALGASPPKTAKQKAPLQVPSCLSPAASSSGTEVVRF